MKPTFSFSAAGAEDPVAASAAAAIATVIKDLRMVSTPVPDGLRAQRSGTKAVPRDAGAADPATPRVRDIKTRTRTVAR